VKEKFTYRLLTGILLLLPLLLNAGIQRFRSGVSDGLGAGLAGVSDAAVAAPAAPTDPPTDGLVAQYHYSDLGLSTLDPIPAYTNHAPGATGIMSQGNVASQAILDEAGLNGFPTATFDTAGDGYFGAAETHLGSATGGVTFIVTKVESVTGGAGAPGRLWYQQDQSGSPGLRHTFKASNTLLDWFIRDQFGAGFVTNMGFETNLVGSAAFHILQFAHDGTNRFMSIDRTVVSNILLGAVTYKTGGGGKFYHLGNPSLGSEDAEMLIYRNFTPSSVWEEAYTYLTNKYDL